MNIPKTEMVDLYNQYLKIKPQIDNAIQEVIDASAFIKGKQVLEFERNLGRYIGSKHVISCANGTDALQIALMALELEPGDEVIVPAFTYAASAEVIALLRLTPVLVDVDPDTFNMQLTGLESSITSRSKVIMPVHLFGQSSDMEAIMGIAKKFNLWVVEDNAQSLGAGYTFSNNQTKKTGTMGQIGCTSFFPTKNLGCFGDGGALFTEDDGLAEKIRMIANHGQKNKYHHTVVGCNSRLDTIQAAVLNVKLNHLDEHLSARRSAADYYDVYLKDWKFGERPHRMINSKHTFNQYTLKIRNGRRDDLKTYLSGIGIPTMIYYPLPLYTQDAFKKYVSGGFHLPITEDLCKSVLSVPIHSEMNEEILQRISHALRSFN